jgi:hypothetical protein
MSELDPDDRSGKMNSRFELHAKIERMAEDKSARRKS